VIEELQTPDVPVESLDPAKPPVCADPRFALNPVQQRFLFVDVAAQRAKQLRKGALNRLTLAAAGDPEVAPHPVPHKAERIAMEEVRRGFIQYELPSGSPLAAPTQEG
jgi:DNA-directed RNA polymerase subunit K/omega